MPENTNYSAIIFQDGDIFYGRSSGKTGSTIAEMCFTTAMTGYQESITDPSYHGQALIFTAVHIGNTGINHLDHESSKPHLKAIITRNKPSEYSHYQANQSLTELMQKNDTMVLHDFDTRSLVEKITQSESKNAMLIASEREISIAENQLQQYKSQITKHKVEFRESMQSILNDVLRKSIIDDIVKNSKKYEKSLIVIDFGVKLNILRLLYKYNFNITVLPCNTDYNNLNLKNFDGIVLSNGPADPKDALIFSEKIVNKIVHSDRPIFGICMGHQILSLAYPSLKVKVAKMQQGHRGINHPIMDMRNKRIMITSQNHGYNAYVEEDESRIRSLISHKSLFDQTIAGFSIKNEKIISVQYHPESSPGTHDSEYLFEEFYHIVDLHDRESGIRVQEKRDLTQLEQRIRYRFKSKELLMRSLRHSSMLGESSYEKLEFIGDKMLNLSLAYALVQEFPKDDEGQLSIKLNKLASGEIIAKVASRIGLGDFIEMSANEQQSNGKNRKNNLEDCMEGLIGGILLDSDFKTVVSVVLRLWDSLIKNAGAIEKDAKTQLQEWLQKKHKILPKYLLVQKEGVVHAPIFKVKLIAKGIPEFEITATTLKEAQTELAKMGLNYVNSHPKI